MQNALAIDAQQHADFTSLRSTIQQLSMQRKSLQQDITSIQGQSADLTNALTEEAGSIKALLKQKATLAVDVSAMQKQSKILAVALAEQASTAQALQENIAGLSQARLDLQTQFKLDRVAYSPVVRVTGVAASMDASFREIGIRTVSDLALAKPAYLTAKLNIPPARASGLVAAAKKKMQM